MRRKMAQAVRKQMECIACLLEVRELFVEFHPEWAELFTAGANNCMVSIGIIKKICILAWGFFPEDLKAWLR